VQVPPQSTNSDNQFNSALGAAVASAQVSGTLTVSWHNVVHVDYPHLDSDDVKMSILLQYITCWQDRGYYTLANQAMSDVKAITDSYVANHPRAGTTAQFKTLAAMSPNEIRYKEVSIEKQNIAIIKKLRKQ
jgi:hypothetical protein